VWLWLLAEPERITADLREALANAENDLYLSSASAWKIAIKHQLGRLPLPEPPMSFVPSRMERSGVAGLAITHRQALHVSTLPSLHPDPFDRLLVAHTQLEGAVLVTADRRVSAYPYRLGVSMGVFRTAGSISD
jgi:PIN domain nuclease of toxin-antitoxin system